MSKKQQGFTLIELMIIIAIIGILTVIVLPAYMDYTARAQAAEAFVQMDGLKNKVQLYFQEEGGCISNDTVTPGDIADQNSIAAKTAYSGHYISEVEVGGIVTIDGGCTVKSVFRNIGVSQALQGKTIVYTLSGFGTRTPQWLCHSPDIDSSNYILLPTMCRFSSFADAQAALN